MKLRRDLKSSAIIYIVLFLGAWMLTVFNGTQLLIFGVPLLVFFLFHSQHKHRLRVRERRRQDGLCVACAYDLRGIDSDRCPECGEPSVRDQRALNVAKSEVPA